MKWDVTGNVDLDWKDSNQSLGMSTLRYDYRCSDYCLEAFVYITANLTLLQKSHVQESSVTVRHCVVVSASEAYSRNLSSILDSEAIIFHTNLFLCGFLL
jgi:hypothetical protein